MKSWTGQPSQVLRRGVCLHDGVEGSRCVRSLREERREGVSLRVSKS